MKRDPFHAIADPTRRAILTLLAVQAMTPNALAEHFDSSRQAVSKHIQVLTECELVSPAPEGREIYYHINPEKMKTIADWLDSLRILWERRFNQLDDLLKTQKHKNNGK
mgnify:CR=1 FL=1